MQDGAPWSDDEVRHQLRLKELTSDVVVPIRVTSADLDPARAGEQQRTRARWIGVLVIVLVAAVVVASLREALREGFTSGSVVLVLLLVSQLALRWFYAASIIGPITAGSQAAKFVDALLKPTAIVRVVKRRWLVFGRPDRQLIVTQEQGWSVTGPHQIAEVRWSEPAGRIVRTADCSTRLRARQRLTFADDSSVALNLTRSAAQKLTAAIAPRADHSAEQD
ncbi:MAG: hypothetical protein ACR2P2_03875 [Nakamurella sp.]